jgi:hypothetical protein
MTKDYGKKIYLAGKIYPGDYRHQVVSHLRMLGEFYENPEMEWPIFKKTIAGKHHYVGPYFIACDHRCSHGKNTHGYGIGCGGKVIEDEYNEHCPDAGRRPHIVKQRENAILNSDIVFAWIDDLTAFGTLFELGLAVKHDKRVILALKNKEEIRENLWFIITYFESKSIEEIIYHDSASEAFQVFLKNLESEEITQRIFDKIESPIERAFYVRLRLYVKDLEPQYSIFAEGHNYRADFAIPSKKIVFEIDGHEFHKTKEQRTSDAQRERDLKVAGWNVIRFTGTEIHNDIDGCIEDARKLIR